MRLLITLLFLAGSFCGFSQTYTMNNGSITTCAGTFYDPGGTGNYASSLNNTYTVCPGTAGMAVRITFSAFNTEWADVLRIYDGTNASAPLLGAYSGTAMPPVITATTSNASGCLTFVFTSDGSVTNPGWTAAFSCVTPVAPTTNITMINGSGTACSGVFLDPGGNNIYANSQTVVYTLCPSTAGGKLQAAFSYFQMEASDQLQIFNGNSIAAPLIGTYSGTTSPGTVLATAANASGCLTFRFTSDGSVTYPGWMATISCISPCQTITSNWVSSNEAPEGDGVIRICQGQSVNFVGSGTFSSSSAGANYVWSMGNGATVNGASMNYTYPAAGSYLVNLTITDPNGCQSTNSINRNVQVSTTPVITTSATPSTLCTNQTSTLAANVTMTPYVINCTPPVSGTTFLPDGSGVSYSTSITTNCYSPAATVTAASDIVNVCLTMEHSYLGDLDFMIICPNGQSVSLKDYTQGGTNTFLGNPIDDDLILGPGTGTQYCFTPTATTFLVNGTTTAVTTPSPGNSLVAGNYKPFQLFDNLIGCPMNGNWTIQVTDHIASDNGYIFSWGINFNASLLPASSFTPTIVSQGWVAATTLSSTGITTANVTPTNQGTPCFTYSLTDNFGCTYTAPQCLTVNCGTSLPIGLLSFEADAVNSHAVRLNWETSSEHNNDYFTIERSMSGYDGWEQVAVVDGAGNSEMPNDYSTVDHMPLSGVSYYRLKQTDYDGSERIHEMESVYIDAAALGDLVIFPNPATDLVTLRGDIVSLTTFKLLNAVGQDVRLNVNSYKQGDGSLVLDISSLRSGVYVIKNGSKVYSLVKQ